MSYDLWTTKTLQSDMRCMCSERFMGCPCCSDKRPEPQQEPIWDDLQVPYVSFNPGTSQ